MLTVQRWAMPCSRAGCVGPVLAITIPRAQNSPSLGMINLWRTYSKQKKGNGKKICVIKIKNLPGHVVKVLGAVHVPVGPAVAVRVPPVVLVPRHPERDGGGGGARRVQYIHLETLHPHPATIER